MRISLLLIVLACLGLMVSGCGEFFEKRPTELESRAVLRDIARIRENPHVNNPLPAVYTDGPRRLKVADGVKLFYFTKYIPVGDLNYVNPADLRMQTEIQGFAGRIRDMGFTVSTNTNTNQLIVHCKDDAECDQVMAYLEKTDVPPIQVHIDCLILERFGDVTKDWETSLLVENLFGEGITIGEGKWPRPAFPGASLRESRRSEFGMDFGYWNDGAPGHRVRAIVDVLESRGYLKILMNPTLETVNGKVATVQIRDYAPIQKVVTIKGAPAYAVTDYQWVADTLTIIPNVYSDGSIGLKTQITIGSKSKPEGVVQTSIITERSVNVGENRILPGKSLIIGGMRKSENRSVVRGVPLLQDIPLLGILFSSKDFEEKATEIIFILTPSISAKGVPYEQMADVMRKKYATANEESGLHDLLNDPLGSQAYTELVEEKTQNAQAEKVRFEMQTDAANRQALADRLRAEKAAIQTQMLKTQGAQFELYLKESVAKKQAAEAQSQAAMKEAELQKAKLSQVETDLPKLQAEADAAKAQAQNAQAALQEAQQKAAQVDEEVRKAAEQSAALEAQIKQLEDAAAAEQKAQAPTESQTTAPAQSSQSTDAAPVPPAVPTAPAVPPAPVEPEAPTVPAAQTSPIAAPNAEAPK